MEYVSIPSLTTIELIVFGFIVISFIFGVILDKSVDFTQRKPQKLRIILSWIFSYVIPVSLLIVLYF